jgi:glutaredoxin
MMRTRIVAGAALLAALALAAVTAAAQQIYRWTDEKGRVHITDTPPPPGARGVKKKSYEGAAAESAAPAPYELTLAMKEYPVTLYTSPICKEPCDAARAALNRRGVPFREVQVWEEKTNAELQQLSGATQVPTLVVGRSVHKGFDQASFDALLDSARYPRAGILPARSQAVPPLPEGYVPPSEREAPQAEPVKPEPAPPAPSGPYAPGGASPSG